MSPHRCQRWLVPVLVGLVALLGLTRSVRAQWTASGSAAVTQSPADRSSTPYPATYPSTDPSTYPSSYPSTYPSTGSPSYPSTADRMASSRAAAMPYEHSLPGITSTPAGLGDAAAGSAGDNLPGEPASSLADPPSLYSPYASPEAIAAQRAASNGVGDRGLLNDQPWTWQVLPPGLMYKSYLAGGREPRFSTQFVHDRKQGWLWDSTLGARVGLIRYGTDSGFWPEGWQLDAEAAAFPLMNLPEREVVASDYRIGMPLTRRVGPWEMKCGYYHYCAHYGDEYVLTRPDVNRINYVRETLIFGLATYLSPDFRLYSEVGWAFHVDGESEPWEFQFGFDWSPAEPTGFGGAPFLATNCHLRQENDFGGNLSVETGWQWRGATGHLFRIGLRYFNGMSEQGQLFDTFQEQIGVGFWYDF